MTGEELIRKAAALRGLGKLRDAINEIEQNRGAFDDITLTPALLQAFYAAVALGDDSKAKALAVELADLEPELPSIRRFL